MRRAITLSFGMLFAFHLHAVTYFISPDGSDNDAGTMDKPFGTIQFAVNKAKPGDILYLRAGTYKMATQINIAPENSGSSSDMIKLWAYNGEKPLLDFGTQPLKSLLRGFFISGDYWHLKGLEIAYADDNGIKLEGNYNIIEQCVFHHNGDSGIQLGFGHTTNQNNPGNLCAYNKIINCDSYRNYDYDNYGSDADGFACKMHNGKGNIFYGCRSWENADDAWDLFETDWPVEIHHCWAWHSADKTFFLPWHLEKTGKATTSFQGNGNGIKLGGDGAGGQSKGTHIASRCVSFNNTKTTSVKGFDQNSHKGGIVLSHCLGFNNGYNYMFETAPASGSSNVFVNNVSIKGTRNDYEIVSGSTEINNSWNLTGTVLAANTDYVDLTEDLAKAPRQTDGSLPNNGFARLVAGSDLIDKGFKIDSVKYNGSAPDLGPYEYGSITTDIEEAIQMSEYGLYPNPFVTFIILKVPQSFSYTVSNMEGKIIEEGKAEGQLMLGEHYQPGLYLIQMETPQGKKVTKVSKL